MIARLGETQVAPGRMLIELDVVEYERMRHALGSSWEWEGLVRIVEGNRVEAADAVPRGTWRREMSKLILRIVQHVDSPALGRIDLRDINLRPIMGDDPALSVVDRWEKP